MAKNRCLRKRIRRILMENKGRYAGIFILIFLGSFALVAMKGFGDGYEALVSRFAEENVQEDLSFSTDRPIADLAALEAEAGALIDPYRYHDITLSGGQQLRLLSPCTRVNIPFVKSGSAPQSPGDILTDPFFATTHGLEIGHSVESGGNTFQITGTVALPHYIYPLKYINDVLPPSGFGIALASPKALDTYPEAETVYAVRFPNRENLNEQAAALHDLLGERGYAISDWTDAQNNKRIRMAWATITGAKTMAVPIPAAMFLLCCLIVGVMIWRTVRADGVIIGTLYAQGYRRRELLRHYMTIPLLLAAAGGLAGVLCGLPLIRPTIDYMASSYYNVPVSRVGVSPLDIAAGVLMPMAFLGLASWLVIQRELRKSAGELMKGDSQKTKVNFLERRLRLDRFQFRTKFQLREQVRSIPQLLFLLLGVTGASVMMLFGFTINHSMTTVFNSSTEDAFRYAVEYSFKETQYGEVPEGADPFNAIRCYPAGNDSAEFYLTGLSPDAEGVILRDKRGNDLPKNQVNITYLLANRMKLKAGDTISFTNKLDGKPYSLVIDGIVQTYAGQFLYMPLDEFNRMTGQPAGSYSGLFSARELEFDEKILAGVKDLHNLDSAMGEIAMPMMLVVVGMTVIAGLMGAIIIFLVTSLMIEESRGTISLFKIFGYRAGEVSRLILSSSTWVVVAGFLLAIPLMLVLAGGMYAYLGEMINMVLPMLLHPLYVLVSFILIFGVYQLTKLLCGKKLAKVSMSEALKAGTE